MDKGDIDQGGEEQKEQPQQYSYEAFVHDPSNPERTEEVIDACFAIEQARIAKEIAFPKFVFEETFHNTVPNSDNEGKPTIAVLVRDPKDNSIFGFIYARPSTEVYSDGTDPKRNYQYHPELLGTENEAYIEDAVFLKSGSGALKGALGVLEDKLREEGYKTVSIDSMEENNFAANIEKNNKDRIIESTAHIEPRQGPQKFIRMRLDT